jgi:hypothetical protein
MSATINCVETWSAEIEIVTTGIAGINAEMPIARIPPKRAIEINCINK